jgi:cytochrome d ubiquinol oxidase subunit I
MVAMGMVMLAIGWVGGLLWLTGRLDRSRWFQHLATWSIPSGFLAVVAGWTTAEVGRQPYVVYGYLRTADVVSPLPAGHVAFTLLTFMVVYAIVFSAGVYYMVRLIQRGPEAPPSDHDHPTKTARRPLSLPDDDLAPAE